MEKSKMTLKGRCQVPFGGQFELGKKESEADLRAKGMCGVGSNFDQLVESIAVYRRGNAIPIGLGFADEVEAEVCRKYPQECLESHPLLPNPEQRLNWRDIMRGTTAMVKDKVGKMTGSVPLVSDEEAERRAAICVECKLNQQIAYGCTGGCPELNNLIAWAVGAKRTSVDDRLKGCGVCHCSLRVAVYTDLKIQQQGLTPEQIEKFKIAKSAYSCWKAPE